MPDDDAVVAVRGEEVVAADAYGFLGEPAEEFGAVGDLAACLGVRLAHLGGHQGRELVGPGGDEFVCAIEDLAA